MSENSELESPICELWALLPNAEPDKGDVDSCKGDFCNPLNLALNDFTHSSLTSTDSELEPALSKISSCGERGSLVLWNRGGFMELRVLCGRWGVPWLRLLFSMLSHQRDPLQF